jgi:hypothetical protein
VGFFLFLGWRVSYWLFFSRFALFGNLNEAIAAQISRVKKDAETAVLLVALLTIVLKAESIC